VMIRPSEVNDPDAHQISNSSLENLEDGTYHDYFRQDIITIKQEIQLPKGKRKGPRGGVVVPFPVKLYAMLEGTQKENLEHIVSWQPHGRSFIVHKPSEFVNDIMPRYVKRRCLLLLE
jgi:HSF-type DNA-binding